MGSSRSNLNVERLIALRQALQSVKPGIEMFEPSINYSVSRKALRFSSDDIGLMIAIMKDGPLSIRRHDNIVELIGVRVELER